MKTLQKPLVLGFALLQPFAAYVSSLGDVSRLMDSASIPLISPAGYAFSIWGIICAGSVLFGFYQLFAKRNADLYEKVAPYALLVFTGFTAWLYAAARDWTWLTVVIFVAMGYGLYRLYPQIVQAHLNKKLSLAEQIVTYGTFGLYAGWTTVAIFANIAVAIKFSGLADQGGSGLLWQGAILVAATAVSMFGIWKTHGSVPYAGAILWAFVAIVVGLLEWRETAAPLLYLALIATAMLALTFIRARFKSFSR